MHKINDIRIKKRKRCIRKLYNGDFVKKFYLTLPSTYKARIRCGEESLTAK